MMVDNPTVGVVGAGAWGTALAALLADKGYPVTLWAREAQVVERINAGHVNDTFLPGCSLPERLVATGDLRACVSQKDLVLVVAPSQHLRLVVRQVAGDIATGAAVVCASKGIENGTLALMGEVLQQELRQELHDGICVLSGPSFAREVAAKMPTNVTLACENGRMARWVQKVFHRSFFRVYTSYDVIGVELGGALKNVMAIAAGGLEGMGFGYNTQCGLVTRGLAEVSRLGVRLGANPLTFAGLSGVGDLVLTCMGSLSRNRTVGQRIGRGEKLEDILAMPQVAEGVETSRSAFQLAQRARVDMPIVEQVYRILHEGKDPKQALDDLLSRDLKDELG